MTGVIYSWLFKFTHQHNAGFTENSSAPPKTDPVHSNHNNCKVIQIEYKFPKIDTIQISSCENITLH